MKKSILITGKQGSGKTTKLNELLSQSDQSKSIEMSYKKFQLSLKFELRSKYDVVAIDEVVSVEQIDYLSSAVSQFGFILIVATQKSVKELEMVDLSAFDVVECSAS
jgi:Tfp pilus assembly pilus retraction ATPase PilT